MLHRKATQAARWLLEQWGYGPVFAVLTVASIFRIRDEAQAASSRQASELAS